MAIAYAHIRRRSAEGDLDKLVFRGCNKRRLLFELGVLMGDPPRIDTWRGLLGLEYRQLKAAVARMEKCADEISALNSGVTARGLMDAEPRYRLFRLLPRQLRLCARFWWVYSKASLRPRAHPSLNAAKSRLTRHVIEMTGKPHDREVSALISATLGKTYDAVAHRAWRNSRGIRSPKS